MTAFNIQELLSEGNMKALERVHNNGISAIMDDVETFDVINRLIGWLIFTFNNKNSFSEFDSIINSIIGQKIVVLDDTELRYIHDIVDSYSSGVSLEKWEFLIKVFELVMISYHDGVSIQFVRDCDKEK